MIFVIAFIVLLEQISGRLAEEQIFTNTTTGPPSSNDDECSIPPHLQTPPDFTSNKTRISEAKCSEYLWEAYKRKEVKEIRRRCGKISIDDNQFVLGGVKTYPGQFPHMGAIGWQGVTDKWLFLCGGSLISPNYILTAAHCTETSLDTRLNDTIPKIVRLGDKIIATIIPKFSQVDAIIKKIIKHPEYKSPMKYNDIALFQLDMEYQFSKYLQPACLWSKPNFNDLKNKVYITGWGATEEEGVSGVPDLLYATVDIIDTETCDTFLKPRWNRHFKGLKDNQMCAGSTNTDTCKGDSGGPIQSIIEKESRQFQIEGTMHYILGVTSFGFGCGRAELPGVYIKVYNFMDWIEPIVWP